VELVRGAILTLHVAALITGVYIAATPAISMLSVASDVSSVMFSRIAVFVALISLTVAYSVVLVRNGFTLIAPLLFVVSYLGIAVVFEVAARAIAKGFPPAPSEDVPFHYAVAITEITAVAALAYLAWRWTKSRSRFPLI
jgi:hypothetical protein